MLTCCAVLSQSDEHLYHEPLVHPVMLVHPNPKRVVIIGGGEGTAAREVLKHKSVESVIIVELDPLVTGVAKVKNSAVVCVRVRVCVLFCVVSAFRFAPYAALFTLLRFL